MRRPRSAPWLLSLVPSAAIPFAQVYQRDREAPASENITSAKGKPSQCARFVWHGPSAGNAAHGTRPPLCRLSNMAEKKEQQIQWQAAMWAIGRVLSKEFECKEDEVPDRMRQLLSELEAKGKRDNKD